jgi:ribulose-phosphate 3-epimerase
VVASLKKVTKLPLDVHLMIEQPERFVEAFVEAGAAMVSVHVEVSPHLDRTLSFIRGCGARAGVVLNPSTPVVAIEEAAREVDYVLVMSVNPGFGGQAFLPSTASKIRRVRALLDAAGNQAPVEVDGGIDLGTVGAVVRAGAEILVAGSSIFHTADPAAAARALREAAERAAAAAGATRA